MNTLSVRRGATLQLSLEIDDTDAISATLTVSDTDNTSVILSKEVTFTDGVADLSLTPEETLIAVGEYIYQITVELPDGVIEKFPDTSNCTDCGFPAFIVCESLDSTEVS